MDYMFYYATSFNQDISNWNVSSVTTATGMFNGVTLPTVVYDGILIKWSKQALKSGVTISFGSSKYSNGLPLESKNLIASTFTWTITDGGSTGETYIDHKKTKFNTKSTSKVKIKNI
jgi:surface protein